MNGFELKKNREKLGLTQKELAEKLGVVERTIVNYEKGEKIPISKNAILQSIFKPIEYSEINQVVSEPIVEYNATKKPYFIPLIPIEAMAGYGNGDNQVSNADITKGYVIPEFEEKKVQYIIRVSGSSMYPKYSNGDLLGCVPVSDLSFFQWGKAYVLDTTQGAMVKRLFPVQENKDLLECRSDNAEKYPPFQIHKDSVYRVSIVVGVIRME